MDPFTASVVSLLSLGAAAVGKGLEDEGIKDAYAALKRFVVARFAKVEPALALAEEPDAGAMENAAIAKRVPELEETDDLRTLVAELTKALAKADQPQLNALIEAERLRVGKDMLFENITSDRQFLQSKDAEVKGSLIVKNEAQKKN